MERFAKGIVPEWRRITRSFQGRRGFGELGHLLHNYILNGKFNPKLDRVRVFSFKIRAFLSIFKKE